MSNELFNTCVTRFSGFGIAEAQSLSQMLYSARLGLAQIAVCCASA
jgi:hypothetical protein